MQQIFIEAQIRVRVGGHMTTYSMKNLPSISVQLTATSAMGILKHWAIYRSSTSKALREERGGHDRCSTAAFKFMRKTQTRRQRSRHSGWVWQHLDCFWCWPKSVHTSEYFKLKICFKMSAQMICPLFHKQIVSYLNKKVPKYLTRIVYFMT